MQVFKLYFKLLKSTAPALILYIVIFTVLIFIISSNKSKTINDFEGTRIEAALVNYDNDSILVKDLLNYLSNYCNFTDYTDREEELKDALFFRNVEYILTIPYDFAEDFISGKSAAVEKRAVPDEVYSIAVDNAVNNYLNTADLYRKTIPDISQEELVNFMKKDMGTFAGVSVLKSNSDYRDNRFYNQYFNTAAYIMLSCCLIGVGMVMLTFHNTDIMRRNLVTPITHTDMSLQLIGGNLIFVLMYDIFFIVLGYIINSDKAINSNVLLYWLNLTAFSISALSISYLSAMIIKSRQVIDIFSTVFPLGLSFISGAFVPQFLLRKSILKIAGFTPVYWFVKGNDTISGLIYPDWDNIKNILFYMLIQIGFAAAFFSVALVVSKNKRQNEN